MTHSTRSSDSFAANSESDTDQYEVRFDPATTGTISTLVAEAVSSVVGTEPEALRPLYDVIDPDALDQLFSPGTESSTGINDESRVSFRYEEQWVHVLADGRVVVVPSDEE